MSIESIHPQDWRTDRDRGISTQPVRRPELNAKELTSLELREASMTHKLVQALDRIGAELALISRRGADLGRYRFDGEVPMYTHMAFAVREGSGWCVRQLLNTHAGPRSHLYHQPLIEFFRDFPHDYRVGLLVPSANLQQRLIALLHSCRAFELFTPQYSRLAYPFTTLYQNSNLWMAEMVGAAQSQLCDRLAIKDYLRRYGLVPTTLRLNPLLQLIGAVLHDNTRFDDHPRRRRLAGKIDLIMEPSLREYLVRRDRIIACEHLVE